MRALPILLLLLFGVPVAAKPRPSEPATGLAPGLQVDPASCKQAALAAEHLFAIPDRLLVAIAEVESIRNDPVTRRWAPWPWTINVDGAGHFYETKQDAIDAVKAFQAAGARSIDVGCMQVNLMFHPNAFASLDEAFDPRINATYAGRFLRDLFHQTASWPQATAFYHSQTPALGTDYATIVMARWPLAGQYADPPAASTAAVIVKAVDYSVYTPAFAAALRNVDRDLARVDPAPVPPAAAPVRRRQPARLEASSHRLGIDQPG